VEYILEVKNIQKRYPKSDFQLKDVSLKLPYGSILGLIGENGSGKTTTLSIILNLRKRDSGTVTLFGKEMLDHDLELKEKIGVVFDMNCFPTHLTAKEISKIYAGVYSKWDEYYFFQTLERFNIPPKRKLKEYSKGMLMTLAILIAMSYHPQLLILDEATSGLDPVCREEMLELFLEFIGDEKKSIIFSSHITTDVEKIADYVTFIHQGSTITNEKKDNLIYEYGIVRCGKEQFKTLDKKYIVKYLKRDYEYSVLVT
jgi:ABC-type multidrug transport system, ATPase component